ncbi:MAG TPA: 4-hydroxythreonine-4-phosphate dehydrogenase PdxA [Saprospiraceae bacterium]|nr:4-hydroxythreonine-4-phosphate dehydrogenase PdxA [Saprospiraceae bacterium]
MRKLKVGITCGDINGIGMEVIIKALNDTRLLNHSIPIIYGSSKIISYHKNIVEPENFRSQNIKEASQASDDRINILNCWNEAVNIQLGEATRESGSYAAMALEACTNDALDGKIDCMVTAPINKHAMSLAGFRYIGHTEYLRDRCQVEQVLMMMCSEEMKVSLSSGHIPVQNVSSVSSKEKLISQIKLLNSTLRMDHGIDKPRIAVLGIQPHAGDNGAIGDEDERITKPAVAELKKEGELVFGPYPADGFFGSLSYKKFDAIMAAYHDQGLIPFKMASFGKGVNMTCGLPIIRSSPDHGTGYDIAGKNAADPSSFLSAYFMAMDAARNRTEYLKNHENPLRRNQALPSEESAD